MSTTRKHIVTFIIMILLLASLFTSCKTLAQTPSIGVSTSDNIGMTQKIIDDITSMAGKDGYSLKVYNASGNYDAQELQINALLESGVNVLAICPVNQTEITRSLDAAALAGVPVVVFERSIENDSIAFFAGYNAAEEGKTAAQAIAENDNGQKNVVVEIVGPDDNPNAVAASKGFHEVIDLIDNITVVKVYSNWNPGLAGSGLESILMRHPEISAIYNSNSSLDTCINDVLDVYDLNNKVGSANHIFRVSASGSKNGYLNAVDGYVDLLIVTPVGDISAAIYEALVSLGSGKTLEETSSIVISSAIPQASVQSSQSSIWGFTTDIE